MRTPLGPLTAFKSLQGLSSGGGRQFTSIRLHVTNTKGLENAFCSHSQDPSGAHGEPRRRNFVKLREGDLTDKRATDT